MRVALLSDVHANAPALRAVLESIDRDRIARLIHAGDLVGYGPYPRETLSLVRERGIVSIAGNHDRGLRDPDAFERRYVDLAVDSLSWTRERLSEADRAFLADLPLERDLADGRLHVAHGAPDRPDAYVYPNDFGPDLLGDEDVLVLGHTHQQAARRFDEGLIVNPGSVGQPRDGERAAYAVVDLETGAIALRRVAYPVDRVRTAVEASGLPSALADRL